MRHYKKLTRAQRQLLMKSGYSGDLKKVYYLTENSERIDFVVVGTEMKKFSLFKGTNTIQEEG